MPRGLWALAAVGVLLIAYVAWQRAKSGAEVATAPAPVEPHPLPLGIAGSPGVVWNDPAGWNAEPPSGVRLTTYRIAGPAGDARCAVYYFGPGQGGGVEANIERWIGEFQNPEPAARSRFESGGMPVHRVRVSGTYVAHAMGSGDEAAAQQGATLLGAIVEGPNGAIFFKLTGPSATVGAAEAGFDAMLASIRPS